jgi:hypothetical protein
MAAITTPMMENQSLHRKLKIIYLHLVLIYVNPFSFRALYNYKPQNDDEVELCEGDIVYVMEKCDDGWFVGTSQRTGIFGTFPGNYVTHI